MNNGRGDTSQKTDLDNNHDNEHYHSFATRTRATSIVFCSGSAHLVLSRATLASFFPIRGASEWAAVVWLLKSFGRIIFGKDISHCSLFGTS
ncbi:Hypothetical protein NTJ_14126 [Nesidiocoris tenuis]|uniref:Uncharacterized protein n=1 Tax=Nesidiocoris tenuis TaxID=355587 RepID=A0ABN7BCA8_9HEMI|nr:Hypothetical protein NTJ_14126 [Nesidiocoris tenuis]